jgi:hypothetical protein
MTMSFERRLQEAAEVLRRGRKPSAQQRRRQRDIKVGERVEVKLGHLGTIRGTVIDFLMPGTYGMPQAARVALDEDGVVDVSRLTKVCGARGVWR